MQQAPNTAVTQPVTPNVNVVKPATVAAPVVKTAAPVVKTSTPAVNKISALSVTAKSSSFTVKRK